MVEYIQAFNIIILLIKVRAISKTRVKRYAETGSLC